MKRRLLLCLPFLFSAAWLPAQTVYTLDSLRTLALTNNKTLAISRTGIQKSQANRQAAGTNYLPKIALVAGYVRTGEEISCSATTRKTVFPISGRMWPGSWVPHRTDHREISGSGTAHRTDKRSAAQMAGSLNAAGQSVADAFRTDTRNMTAGAIILTQTPLHSGKIRAYDRN